jgi:hypothetical protein
MEVHAHTHTPRKKWTHYFWEFLMLFLAVFCGFLAEYQLEHTIERQRAKEYAQSLYKDLQSDTADIRKAGLYENFVVAAIDSLVNFISSPNPAKKSGTLYYYMRFATWRYNVDWNKATLDQLVSSGNLRYFTNMKLVTTLSKYNTVANMITDTDNRIAEKRMRAAAIRDYIGIAKYERVFSSITMDDIFNETKNAFIDSLRNTDMPIQNNSSDMLNAFANALLDTKGNRRAQQEKNYPLALGLAIEILDLLRKEYHLK